jgi:hypothetical protein
MVLVEENNFFVEGGGEIVGRGGWFGRRRTVFVLKGEKSMLLGGKGVGRG